MADADERPEFEITQWPQRRYPPDGGVQYEGASVFELVPDGERADETLTDLVGRVLDSRFYTYGDWFDLPMPLYLVHDEELGDVFRVAVRDGTVELHVLPETSSAALRSFYERVRERSGAEWDVRRKSA